MRELVGRNVKRIRQEEGLTQEQLAELSGFSHQYISSLETSTDRAASAEPLHAQLWPNNFHRIVQNRLALLGEESVSVGHRRHPLSVTSGDPTHAHLHYWQ
jgi:hypothetical protein